MECADDERSLSVTHICVFPIPDEGLKEEKPMRRTLASICDPVRVAGSIAVGLALLMTSSAWSQVPPIAEDAVKGATGTAQDAVRGATGTAQDAARNARDTARDATRDLRETTQDARRDLRDTTRDARDAAQDARETSRETIDDTRRNLRTNQSIRAGASQRTTAQSEFRAADLGLWFDRSAPNGLIIADVATDAALAQAGFMEGDRIVSVAGQPVTTEADFVRLMLRASASNRVNVIVMRDGQQQTLFVDPIMLRERVTTVNVDPLERFGIILDDRINDKLVVWRVIPRSPAFYAGIRAGDVLTMFAGQRVENPDALVQIVESTEPGLVPIQVTRNGRVRVIEADFPEYQVSERRTTLRQDLDVDSDIRIAPDSGRMYDQRPYRTRRGWLRRWR